MTSRNIMQWKWRTAYRCSGGFRYVCGCGLLDHPVDDRQGISPIQRDSDTMTIFVNIDQFSYYCVFTFLISIDNWLLFCMMAFFIVSLH